MNAAVPYPAHIASLKPYVPGLPISEVARRIGQREQDIAKLASNENPLGASPRALQALARAALDLSRYPDNECHELVTALAEHHEVPRDWIVTGPGSESLILMATQALLAPGRRALYSQYSFQAFATAAQKTGATPIVVDSPEFVVDLQALQHALVQQPSLVYIANPGNPTGTCVAPDALERFLRSVPADVVVLLDEAYFDFLAPALRPDSIRLVRELPNLLVTRTFSKAHGLAGLRVGYGIAQPALAQMLRRVRVSFTVTDIAQVAATAALDDTEFLARTLEHNELVRAAFTGGLDALGLRHLPSHTNFVLVETGDGLEWTRRLERRGFLVRPVTGYGLARWIRVSMGTADEMRRLLAAMQTELAR